MLDATQVSAERDDYALIRAIAQRDEKAMEILFRAHSPALLRFVFRRMNESHEDAEEVMLDTFYSVIDLAPTFRGESTAYVWLCGIARLRIIDRFRKETREKRAPREKVTELREDIAIAFDTASDVEDRFQEAHIVDLLAQVLSEDEREAFMMRHVDGFSLDEIASVLKRSLRATEGIVYRAKQKLRAAVIEGRVGEGP